MNDEEMMNSERYWNKRFSTDWEEQKGRGQTAFFGTLALELLPGWVTKDIQDNKLTIADVGCAEGDATVLLSKHFPNSKVVGIDFSQQAILNAKSYYPEITFVIDDVNKFSEKYDVIFSSNTLEHFSDPFNIISKLTTNSNKYIILLLPFEEYSRIEEHFHTFEYRNFPLSINHFSLVYFKEVRCEEIKGGLEYWPGKQFISIYANGELINLSDINLELLNGNLPVVSEVEAVSSLTERVREYAYREENYIAEIRQLQERYNELEMEFNKETEQYNEVYQSLNQANHLLSRQVLQKEQELHHIYKSDMWRLAKKYYSIRDKTILRYIYRSAKIIKTSGLRTFFKKAYQKIYLRNRPLHMLEHQKQLNILLKRHANLPIIIFPDLVDWNIPLFQRPQHIALRLSRENYLYFYCTPNNYDDIHGFKQISNNCFLTNRLDLLKQIKRKKIIHLYSTDMNPTNDFINDCLSRGDTILYEYIDEIHEDLSGEIPEYVRQKHLDLIANENCLIVATATKLYDEVKKYRQKNVELITNGVDYDHFQQKFKYEDAPQVIKILLDRNSPVIGYYGALASWFDYDLIIKLAKERPNYQILLIGWEYDDSLNHTEVNQLENVTIIGPVDYKELPRYAYWFDISIIPFILNDITESTSPIKLFEYMALGKPIITTDLPECRKYEPILIGRNHQEFIELIDTGLTLKENSDYKALLEKEALYNTWDSKAKSIVELLERKL